MTRKRKTPTLAERAERIAMNFFPVEQASTGEDYADQHELRAWVLHELRAAVRQERVACARECDELYAIAIVREQRLDDGDDRGPVKASAAIDECADRIRRRKRP